jgi:hypothetical protein
MIDVQLAPEVGPECRRTDSAEERLMATAKDRMMLVVGLLTLTLCIPVLPSTARSMDVEGWKSDVDFVVEKVASIHPRPWYRVPEERFKKFAEELKDDVADLSDEEIAVRLMQLVARVGDGHTTLFPVGLSEFANWFPVRFDQFADGIFITAISSEHQDFLGAKVLRMGRVTADEAFERVGSVAFADSRHGWPRSVPPLLSNTAILRTLGIVESDELPLEVWTPRGERRRLRNAAASWRVDFGWTRWGFRAPDGVEHVNVYTHIGDREETLPLHLRHLRDTPFWFELLPEHRAMYVQFNSVSDGPDETLERFTRRLGDFFEEHSEEIDKFVVDLSYNPGGNGYLLRPFINGFVEHHRVNRRGRLYAIVGPGTFSTSSRCLGEMLLYTDVISVGEAVAGPFNWFSDTQLLELPHSGLPLRVSALFWQRGHPSDARGYAPPEHPVRVLASDLFAGKDRAFEAILAGEVRTLADILQDEGSAAFVTEYEKRSAEFTGVDWWFPYREFDLTFFGYEMLRDQRLGEPG